MVLGLRIFTLRRVLTYCYVYWFLCALLYISYMIQRPTTDSFFSLSLSLATKTILMIQFNVSHKLNSGEFIFTNLIPAIKCLCLMFYWICQIRHSVITDFEIVLQIGIRYLKLGSRIEFSWIFFSLLPAMNFVWGNAVMCGESTLRAWVVELPDLEGTTCRVL